MEKNVRLTGGEFSGQKIATPGGGTHPMGERERLALFNMLGEQISGATVLDLFAGGGTLGFEALSRGASDVYFVENDRNACKVIQQNVAKLGVAEKCEVLCSKVENFVLYATDVNDIVFADPPYDAYREEMLKNVAKTVREDGMLILSHPNEAPTLDGLKLLKTRQYAGAHLSFYKKDD